MEIGLRSSPGFWGTVGALALLVTFVLPTLAYAAEPFGVATYHAASIYWTPGNGSADRDVRVKFRATGTTPWRDGLSLRYNPVEGTTEDKATYRGSLVNLTPDTTYEVSLALEGTQTTATFNIKTWSETPPIGETRRIKSGTSELSITDSGTATGYLLYDGTGSTIDVGNQDSYNIRIDASYVIVRGLTLKGAKRSGIRIFGGDHIIIEDCDISGWGDLDFDGDFGRNTRGAVFSTAGGVKALVVQRCRIHHPRHDSNSWAERNCHAPETCTYHPAGPQAIVLFQNYAGNHVFRYNEIWSDPEHYFNDVLGGGSNGSYTGFPGPDSDIYGNYVANGWDDGIEVEGGGQNVRIWGNYIDQTFMAIGNAPVSIGPMYIWKNVGGRSFSPKGSRYGEYGSFLKMGYAGAETWQTGHIYVFNNTVFQDDDQGFGGSGATLRGPSTRIHKHVTTRNNIFENRSDAVDSISVNGDKENNDFDYDLFNKNVPADHEAHGIRGRPDYVSGAGFDQDTYAGSFALKPTSPGYDKGTVIPNFSEGYQGAAPDMGAHENGLPMLRFGRAAASQSQTDPPKVDPSITIPQDGQRPTLLALKTQQAPQIDGELEACLWNSIVVNGFPSNETDNTVRFSITWDNAQLYVGIEVLDADIDMTAKDLWNNDGIELFFDVANRRADSLQDDDVHIIIGADGTLWKGGATAQVAGRSTEAGYTLELGIAWSVLGLSEPPSEAVGFLVANNDRDQGSTVFSDWAGAVDAAGKYGAPNLWGELTLSPKTLASGCEKDESTPNETDPADASGDDADNLAHACTSNNGPDCKRARETLGCESGGGAQRIPAFVCLAVFLLIFRKNRCFFIAL